MYSDCLMTELAHPYVSGFLAFREAPALLAMLHRLRAARPHLDPQVSFPLCVRVRVRVYIYIYLHVCMCVILV